MGLGCVLDSAQNESPRGVLEKPRIGTQAWLPYLSEAMHLGDSRLASNIGTLVRRAFLWESHVIS